jgi:hypothetical protein
VLRILLAITAAVFTACGPTAPPVEPPKADPTTAPDYLAAVEQLGRFNLEANKLLAEGRLEKAGELITNAQPLTAKLLSVPRPTLTAMEAASDHDDLYGRMLLANKHYGWARMFFQKNLARWSTWKPQTKETELRRKRSEAAIMECDRLLASQSSARP